MTTMAAESRISPQAQTLINALLGIGIPRRDFSVRTDRHRLSWVNPATGMRERWMEYGAASVLFKSISAQRTAIARAQELADQNLSVTTFADSCGHVTVILVWTAWNGAKTVTRRTNPGLCAGCTKEASDG